MKFARLIVITALLLQPLLATVVVRCVCGGCEQAASAVGVQTESCCGGSDGCCCCKSDASSGGGCCQDDGANTKDACCLKGEACCASGSGCGRSSLADESPLTGLTKPGSVELRERIPAVSKLPTYELMPLPEWAEVRPVRFVRTTRVGDRGLHERLALLCVRTI